MGEIKQRDYVFDTFRGLCMWCIPISHFTRMAGHFSHDSVSGVIYITINIFCHAGVYVSVRLFFEKTGKEQTNCL